MRDSNYSRTWEKNSELIQRSLYHSTPYNFYKGSSFAGLYERPSPFPYRKYTELGTAEGTSRGFVEVLRERFRLVFDEWNLRVGLQSGRLKGFEDLLPPKASFDPQDPPFFWPFTQKKMNGPYLKAAEQIAILLQEIDPAGVNSICEIGAGFGALAETAIFQLKPQRYSIIDLPEMLEVSFGYLSAQAEGAKRARPFLKDAWRGQKLFHAGTEISFIDATEPDIKLPGNVDLFLNSSSFAEMDKVVLDKYLDLIERNPGTKLLSSNPKRVEGSFLFDPDSFVQGRIGWRLMRRDLLSSHQSFRDIFVTIHVVGAS